MIWRSAKNNTSPRMNTSVLNGVSEVSQSTPSVSTVIPMCQRDADTIKRDIKISAEAKKVNQISQGSIPTFENFLWEVLSANSSQSSEGQGNAQSGTSVVDFRLNCHCGV